jgi:hypothetical protein
VIMSIHYNFESAAQNVNEFFLRSCYKKMIKAFLAQFLRPLSRNNRSRILSVGRTYVR